MALIDDFKTRFPEFDTADVDARLPNLETVYDCYYGGVYGVLSCDDEIILNLLAHLLVSEIQVSKGADMAVTSESVGSVSRSFAVPQSASNNYAFFGSTKYGQRYLQLIAKNTGAYFV